MGTSALHKSSESGGDFQTTYQLGKKHLIVGGLEAIGDRVNSSSFGVQEATRGAVYLQDEIEIAKPLTVTLGLRYDYHSDYNNQLDPRLGVLLRLPEEVRLRASAGRSFRAPTFNDLYWPATAFTAGNPNLQPETAWNYELGAEKSFQNLAAIKIAGFYRDVKDLINWAPDADYFWRPSNISDAKIWGRRRSSFCTRRRAGPSPSIIPTCTRGMRARGTRFPTGPNTWSTRASITRVPSASRAA
jgi:outer membrane receptor protein involved in Fe transport